MRYRDLGRTGVPVSVLALGTVELGVDYGIPVPGRHGRPDAATAIRLVHAALDMGINLIDTARRYGTSEAILGKALQGKREDVFLTTKVFTRRQDGTRPGGAELKNLLYRSLEESLTALCTDYVDLWQIHDFDTDLHTKMDIVTEVFEVVQKRGQIRWCGASTAASSVVQCLLKSDFFDVIQTPFSVFDQRLTDLLPETDTASRPGLMARSVLLKGALTERADHLPVHLEPLRRRSRQYRALLAESGLNISAAQAAIAFALAKPFISSILIGIRDAEELTENIMATEIVLPEALVAQLDALRLDDVRLLEPGRWSI